MRAWMVRADAPKALVGNGAGRFPFVSARRELLHASAFLGR
jgi:hypothetical protein